MSEAAISTRRAPASAFQRTLQGLLGDWFSTIPERLIVFQLACQLGMLVGFLAPLRKLFRAGSFGSSAAILVYLDFLAGSFTGDCLTNWVESI